MRPFFMAPEIFPTTPTESSATALSATLQSQQTSLPPRPVLLQALASDEGVRQSVDAILPQNVAGRRRISFLLGPHMRSCPCAQGSLAFGALQLVDLRLDLGIALDRSDMSIPDAPAPQVSALAYF